MLDATIQSIYDLHHLTPTLRLAPFPSPNRAQPRLRGQPSSEGVAEPIRPSATTLAYTPKLKPRPKTGLTTAVVADQCQRLQVDGPESGCRVVPAQRRPPPTSATTKAVCRHCPISRARQHLNSISGLEPAAVDVGRPPVRPAGRRCGPSNVSGSMS
jgi:hypothetical protein